MAINDNVKASTDEYGCIEDGQLASYVRCSMENKNLLQNKYDIYVGTGNYVGEIDNGKYVSRETEGMNIIKAINAATTTSDASAININSDTLKIDYSIKNNPKITSGSDNSGRIQIGSFTFFQNQFDTTSDTGKIQIPSTTALQAVLGSADGRNSIYCSEIDAVGNVVISDDRYCFLGSIGTVDHRRAVVCSGIDCSGTIVGQIGSSDGANKNAIYCTTIDSSNITSSSIRANGAITSTGEITAQSFNAQSDARLKTNIKSFEYHNSILDVPVREYDWKESGEHAIGFVAQELQEVYPELVNEGEGGMLRIKETKLIYLLIEEVKKLKKEVKDLKKEG